MSWKMLAALKPLQVGDSVDLAMAYLVVLGLSNNQIAHRLSYSESAVSHRIGKILERLGAHSRSGLAGVLFERHLDACPVARQADDRSQLTRSDDARSTTRKRGGYVHVVPNGR